MGPGADTDKHCFGRPGALEDLDSLHSLAAWQRLERPTGPESFFCIRFLLALAEARGGVLRDR